MDIKELLNENGQFKDSALEHLYQLVLKYCYEEEYRKFCTREKVFETFKNTFHAPSM